MIPRNANEKVFTDLVRFQIELWNAVDARLKAEVEHGLATLEPLRAIDRRDDCRVNDVADELVITIGGASKVVDRLEARGFCLRRANPGDRRSSLLAVTEVGEAWLARASRVYDDELGRRLGPAALAGADLEALARILRSLRSSLDEPATTSERTSA